jgi:(p)ppGpp synthase/HD superfamily hydrolase
MLLLVRENRGCHVQNDTSVETATDMHHNRHGQQEREHILPRYSHSILVFNIARSWTLQNKLA